MSKFKRPSVIAFINPTPGVGKTSSIVRIAEIFAAQNESVLIIDTDPKNNLATYISQSEFQLRSRGLIDVLEKKCLLSEATYKSRLQIPFIPTGSYIEKIEKRVSSIDSYKKSLGELLQNAKNDYDVILIDTPSRLGITVSLVMMVCDYYLIPVATRGDSGMVISEMEKIHNLLESKFSCGKFLGAYHSMLVAEDKYSKFTIKQLASSFPGKMFESVIPFTPDSNKRKGAYERLTIEINLKIHETRMREFNHEE